jgi:hypothetical protein
MKTIFTILTILIISSCQTNNIKTLEGDLYFKLIELNIFAAPDSVLTKIEISAKTVNKDTLTEQDKQLYEYLEFMTDKQLLRKPYIRLRQDDGKIVTLFLDKSDYAKVKDINHNDLVRDNKRIRIKAEVTVMEYDSLTSYETIKLISVDKIDGKTYWEK